MTDNPTRCSVNDNNVIIVDNDLFSTNIGKTVLVNGKCYTILGQVSYDDDALTVVPESSFMDTCDDCCAIYFPLVPCESLCNPPDVQTIYANNDLSSFVGKYININGICYRVDAGTIGTFATQNIVISNIFTDCSSCQNAMGTTDIHVNTSGITMGLANTAAYCLWYGGNNTAYGLPGGYVCFNNFSGTIYVIQDSNIITLSGLANYPGVTTSLTINNCSIIELQPYPSNIQNYLNYGSVIFNPLQIVGTKNVYTFAELYAKSGNTKVTFRIIVDQ